MIFRNHTLKIYLSDVSIDCNEPRCSGWDPNSQIEDISSNM